MSLFFFFFRIIKHVKALNIVEAHRVANLLFNIYYLISVILVSFSSIEFSAWNLKCIHDKQRQKWKHKLSHVYITIYIDLSFFIMFFFFVYRLSIDSWMNALRIFEISFSISKYYIVANRQLHNYISAEHSDGQHFTFALFWYW